MEKFLKNINKVLKDYEPLTDFISKIVLAIITISIAIIANNIANEQKKIEEISLIPNIIIEKNISNIEETIIKIFNNGGPVYNFKSQLFTLLNITYSGEKDMLSIPIRIYATEETGNQTGFLLEYHAFINKTAKDYQKKINDRLSQDNLDYTIKANITTYLKISYADKMNNSNIKYFHNEYLINEDFGKYIEEKYNKIEPIYSNDIYFDEIYKLVYNYIVNDI